MERIALRFGGCLGGVGFVGLPHDGACAIGAPDLLRRRAAFGLLSGPCARQGNGAWGELVGSRPDGATPEGVLDLAGNVAEWTREPNGGYSARGGSFRSTSAAELKSWAAQAEPNKGLHIGFRCA